MSVPLHVCVSRYIACPYLHMCDEPYWGARVPRDRIVNAIHLMIHQDTPRYKITIHVSWTRHDEVRICLSETRSEMQDTCLDTCGIVDTCEIHVSARVIKIHAGYIQDIR
jgi:hypothetical protein